MYLKIILIAVSFLFCTELVHSQSTISGKIINQNTGEIISGANILLNQTKGTVSDLNGYFIFEGLSEGKYQLNISFIGFSDKKIDCKLNKNSNLTVDVKIEPVDIEKSDIIITATKTENRIKEIPNRINFLTAKQMNTMPIYSIDDALNILPGISVNRSFGIFSSKSTVSMRGLGTKEQARILVLMDDVPINKSDGGTVDWNVINPEMIKSIEVIKGPGSSLYGSNAMGGIINFISQKPLKPFAGNVSLEYGTFNTFGGKLLTSGISKLKNNSTIYWIINGFYRQSDGYITQSEEDQKLNKYITKSNVKEYGTGLKFGYDINNKNNIEISFNYFNDDRETGEKVYQPKGNVTGHKNYSFILKYKGNNENAKWSFSAYYLEENYRKVNEYLKDDYTWYNVDSKRSDIGFLSSYSYKINKSNRITAGFDLKRGAVDAADVYLTSTDVVYNKGMMDFAALFLQDEMVTFNNKFKIIAGIRMDYARYHDGAFTIDLPTAETVYMKSIQNDKMSTETWSAISPKIAFQYNFSEANRIYLSWSKGFRPSVLDDLCRTGRIKGGLKIANPALKPEYIDNYEIGTDLAVLKNISVTGSVFYSLGTDFMYYVSTGKNIDMGFGDRPILSRANISEVEIIGTEIDMNYEITTFLSFFANYTYTKSKIRKFNKITDGESSDLTGMYLTDTPKNIANAGLIFKSSIVNIGMFFRYTDKMWINDTNSYDEIVKSDQYPDYSTIDIKISKALYKTLNISLSIQNVFDTKFYDSKGAVCPGRFITTEIKYNF